MVVWLGVLVIYTLAALAYRTTGPNIVRWYRNFDPVYLTAGIDGKGSLAKLQVLFFSLIVAGLLSYIVVRTGVLSELSGTILMLMGIAGIGSAAAKGTDLHRNRIEPDNAAWLASRGWLPKGGMNTGNSARWRDIVTSDGEFDVYRYQTAVFSLIVGGALLAAGINELASFTIPQTLLGILGLSQMIYIGGKLVTPTSLSDLNKSLDELRTLEKTFAASATTNPDPRPEQGGDALAVARRRAGEAAYRSAPSPTRSSSATTAASSQARAAHGGAVAEAGRGAGDRVARSIRPARRRAISYQHAKRQRAAPIGRRRTSVVIPSVAAFPGASEDKRHGSCSNAHSGPDTRPSPRHDVRQRAQARPFAFIHRGFLFLWSSISFLRFGGEMLETLMATGTVKWFNGQKGYGFIQPSDGGKDVFVHISAVERAGLSSLNEGQQVSYELVTGRNGKASAENLRVK